MNQNPFKYPAWRGQDHTLISRFSKCNTRSPTATLIENLKSSNAFNIWQQFLISLTIWNQTFQKIHFKATLSALSSMEHLITRSNSPRGGHGLKNRPGNFQRPLYRPNVNSTLPAQPWQHPKNRVFSTQKSPFYHFNPAGPPGIAQMQAWPVRPWIAHIIIFWKSELILTLLQSRETYPKRF